MIARPLVRTLALLLYAAGSGAAVLTPPDIPEQPLIRTIYEWGDRIAVIAYRWLPAEKRSLQELSVVDDSTSRVVPVRVPGCDVYHDVAYGAGLGKLLVCGTGKSAHVYRQAGASWTAVSEPLQGTGFRFAVDGERIAVVSESAVFLMSASLSGRQPSTPVRIAMQKDALPSALHLDDDALLLAYDQGEFGGGLYRMDLMRADKPLATLVAGNVAALARAESGEIWAAGGVAHMASVDGALYRIGGKGVEVIAAISGMHSLRTGEEKIEQQSGARFPGLTTVSGLALGKDGRPALVLPEFGVFAFAGDRFVPLYRGALGFQFDLPGGGGAGSWPVGLAIGKTGEMYVANAVLGIFVLRRDGGRYDLMQLLFHDPAQDKAPGADAQSRRP